MVYRTEHPKPQFMRDNWLNLNGEWDFELDNGRSGIDRKMYLDGKYTKKINVPFCPQSKLSGLEITDFMYGVWYRRTVELTPEQIKGKTYIHFGAVDYYAKVWINGHFAGEHKGGYISWKLNISKFVRQGENTIAVYAEDDERDPMIPRGKQSEEFHSHGCDYTRTTGIWQTVWLEFTPADAEIYKFRFNPDVAGCALYIKSVFRGDYICAEAFYEGKSVGFTELECGRQPGNEVNLSLKLSEKHLWEVGHGRLYDVIITAKNSKTGDVDVVKSYFGLREVRWDDLKFRLNGEVVFQRTILDQGFYPDGIYTAPSDEELHNDILRSMALGFNGARLHQKIFEERFLYHAAKEGYMVWGEYPNWGLDHTSHKAIYPLLYEWLEEIDRDFNEPAIIGWCPYNETWDKRGRRQKNEVIRAVYKATKAADNTRPVIDTSGNYHTETDIYDIHDYNQNFTEVKEQYDNYLLHGGEAPRQVTMGGRQEFHFDKPFFVSEYGGIKWSSQTEGAWGYGKSVENEKEFIERYRGLTEAFLNNPWVMGFCYTQLTDVEQEQNGLYTYDRQLKFPAEIFKEINTQTAAIEKADKK